ncbi:hypothetical protein BgiBS90_017164, partial [Biomphalaria glabrata]
MVMDSAKRVFGNASGKNLAKNKSRSSGSHVLILSTNSLQSCVIYSGQCHFQLMYEVLPRKCPSRVET